MAGEQKKTTDESYTKGDDAGAPMSNERREALRKILLSAAVSVPVVTTLLAPRVGQAIPCPSTAQNPECNP